VTFHDYARPEHLFGCSKTMYGAIQLIAMLREQWVASMGARVEAAAPRSGQQIPYVLLP
jgi:hypothetical protein